MARKQNLLNDLRLREAVAKAIEKARASKASTNAERFNDGGGLILVVTAAGRARFLYRYSYGGASKSIWFDGTYPRDVSLAEARLWRDANAKLLDEQIDPAAARSTGAKADPTLAEYARTHFARLAPMRDQQHAERVGIDRAPWFRDVAIHCGPLARMKIDAITTSHIQAALSKYWTNQKPSPTGKRLCNVLARILKHRHVIQHRDQPYWQNPAEFETLCILLGDKPHHEKHMASLPFDKVPAFVAKLRQDETMAARLAEWIILTGCRANEACGATWSEINWKRRLWVIPPERLKTERSKDPAVAKPFMVPLSLGMVRLLRRAAANRADFAPTDLLFPGMGMFRNAPVWRRAGCPTQAYTTTAVLRRVQMIEADITVHGFRASFVLWGTTIKHRNHPEFDQAVMDRAIGHMIGAATSVEDGKAKVSSAFGSYAKNGEDFFLPRRRIVMREWSAYIDGTERPKKVAPIADARSGGVHRLRLAA
jgi:integrase